MKKLSLTVIGLYLMFLHAFSQSTKQDTTVYTAKPLQLEEINFVSSYYKQEGNHSAVTGGIGNEHVVDLSNGLELKFVGWDPDHNKHSLNLGLGFDHHTAASSAYVSKSGASSTQGTRVYPSIDWTMEKDNGNAFGLGVYYSGEYNYKSLGLDIHTTKKFNSTSELNAKVSGYFDKVKMIYPSELIPGVSAATPTTGSTAYYTTASGRSISLSGGFGNAGSESIPSNARNTYTASVTYVQVINKVMQASINMDVVGQSGYLGLPFHRVYFTDGTVHVENLPSTRTKMPIGLRLNYFLGDNIIFRTYYRYYQDNWGIHSHTVELEVPVKLNAFVSVSPFYRYYTQTASQYFAAYGEHKATDTYYTSNFSLSALQSQFIGVGFHLAPPNGIFTGHINSMEVRYGHYTQSTDLYSDILSFAFTFK